jgi:hypothetical protein
MSTDHIASLCARCDSASANASASLAQLAAQTGPRNRREHALRVGQLDRAALALVLALWVPPHADDPLPATLRQYATTIHGYAVNHLNVLRS